MHPRRWRARLMSAIAPSGRDVEGGKHHYRYRALDQPVCGMHRRDGRTTLFVQREVPGIYGEDQDCCQAYHKARGH